MRRALFTADDYGLSDGTNASIEALASMRVINAGRDSAYAGRAIDAVSVMAHRGARLGSVRALAETGVAVGLHLCFTREAPWSRALGDRLPPSYAALFATLAARPSFLALLASEARAQAEALLARGVTPAFVNGHEHAHLFPWIWPITRAVTKALGCPAIRVALGQPVELSAQGMVAACSRAVWAVSPIEGVAVLSPLGVGHAGSITRARMDALLARPFEDAPGRLREICFHPSFDTAAGRAEHALLASERR